MANMNLTKKEIEVMKLISEGLEDEEIADKSYIALSTLKTHKHNIYCKLGLHDRTKSVKRLLVGLYYIQHKWELKELLDEY